MLRDEIHTNTLPQYNKTQLKVVMGYILKDQKYMSFPIHNKYIQFYMI